jgi:hypothetical protein
MQLRIADPGAAKSTELGPQFELPPDAHIDRASFASEAITEMILLQL